MAAFFAILLSFLLSLALWIFLRSRRPERADALIGVYIMGIVLNIPVLIFELAVNTYVARAVTGIPLVICSGFISTGLVEELLLFFALYAEVKHARLLHSRFDVAAVGLYLGAGLAFGQMILQALIPGRGLSPLRAVICLPICLVCTTLMGWWYGRTKVYPVPVAFNNTCAVLLPILLHGALETGALLIQAGYHFGYILLFALLIPAFGLFLYYLLSKLPGYGREGR